VSGVQIEVLSDLLPLDGVLLRGAFEGDCPDDLRSSSLQLLFQKS
jgi:hypothetical protein